MYLDKKVLDHIAKPTGVLFTYRSGQLMVRLLNYEIHCPATGNWIGQAEVDARTMFRRMPSRFIQNPVSLVYEGGKLFIAGHAMDAEWTYVIAED
jgi:hypothetical protein